MQVEETTPSTPLRPTRAGFVRGLPLTMPVEEVIERGREAGIELQPSDIHAARYYMRQVGAGEGSSIPQQLLLGGTFVTKREQPRKGRAANGATSATSANGANGASANGTASTASTNGSATATQIKVEKQKAQELDELDFADESDEEESVVTTTSTKRGRGKLESKAELRASKAAAKNAEKHADHAKAKGANGLHSRLQARLRNATFRDTAREERDAKRDEKATIGKALLDLDNNTAKPKGKRAAQTADAVEQQLRLIALRVGTQRVRDLMDEMEALAARA